MRSVAVNGLSLLRIPLAFVVLLTYIPSNTKLLFFALALIFLALATDFIDGFLARKYKLSSESGYIIDGLADRSFYVALVLTMVAAHSLSITVAWLLIGRELGMYALRLLQRPHWFTTHRSLRKASLWHAGSIRIWFLTYFLADVLGALTPIRLYSYVEYRLLQWLLLAMTLAAGYTSLIWLTRQLLLVHDRLSERLNH
jgi:phosphatidylglycerophosphate synthase